MIVNGTGTWNSTSSDALGGFLINGGLFTAPLGSNTEEDIAVLPNTAAVTFGGSGWALARTNVAFPINVFPGAGAAFGQELTFTTNLAAGTTTYLDKLGAGTLIFGGATANGYTQQTVVDEGTLILAKTGNVNAATGAVVVGNFGSTASVKVTAASNEFNTAEPIIVNRGGTFDISGASNTAQSASNLDLRAGTVTMGTNTLNVGGTVTGLATSTTGATIAGNTLAGLVNLTANATINTADYAVPTAATILAGTTGATESGNTVTITTTAAHGFLAGEYATITGVGQAAYNGTFLITGVTTTAPFTFTYVNGTAGLTGSGGGTVTAVMPGLSIPAVISNAVGAFTLTKGGAGTLVLNATTPNTYSGSATINGVTLVNTAVNAGTLLLGDSGGAAVPGNLEIGDGLGGTGANKGDVVRALLGNQLPATSLVTVLDSGLLDLNGRDNTLGIGQTNALSLTGGSITTGVGTLTIAANVLGVASATNQMPASITGNLNLNAATRTFDTQFGSLALNNPNVTLANTNDMAISAVITNGSLTKIDTGKLQLTGANGYTGATFISGGILLVDGSQPGSAVTVGAGGTLGGTGTTGTVTAAGGLVSPGDPIVSKGTLTSSATSLAGGSLTVQISGANSPLLGNSLTYDVLNLGASTLTLNSSSTLTLDLNGLTTSTGGPITIIQDAATVGSFSANNITVLNNPNNLQVSVTNSAAGVTVNLVGAATSFLVSAASPQGAGNAFNATVTAVDAFGNTASGYTGTVTLGSSDARAVFVPASYAFTGADLGTHTFSVTLKTTGLQTLTASDSTLSGTLANVLVTAGPPASITASSGTGQAVAVNSAFAPLVVTVFDSLNNPVPNTSVTLAAPAPAGASGTFGSAAITTASESSTTVTITAAQNFVAGESVVITGLPAGHNGTFTILTANASSFTYTDAPGLGISSGGTAALLNFIASTNSSGQLSVPFTANTHAGTYSVSATANSGTNPSTSFTLTNSPGAAASISATSGTPQAASVGQAFGPLVVAVTDNFGNLVPGASVTFTAPSSTGPSGTFTNASTTITANTNAGGQLSEAFTANGTRTRWPARTQ